MRWLMLIIIFEMADDGNLQLRSTDYRVYRSEAQCNDEGRNFRRNNPMPAHLKSISMCVPESAFDGRPEPAR